MRLGLTYDLQTDPQDERQAEFDPPRTVEALTAALAALGHDVVRLGSAREVLASRHQVAGIELVFNIAEGSQGRCREAWAPSLLELLGIPYVGSDPAALSLGLDKVTSKRLAAASGIPTPRWMLIERAEAIPSTLPLTFPVIVKPRYEGSGLGIDEGAVVHGPAALAQRVRWLCAQWQQPVLIEELIPEGELTVCVIGNTPPTAYPAIQRPIDPTSRLSSHVTKSPTGDWITPLELSESLDRAARRMARVMFQAIGCRDVARVDLRVDERGHHWFLEINPLPSFDPEGSFGLLAEYLGMTYAQMMGLIVEAARRRMAHERDDEGHPHGEAAFSLLSRPS